MHETLGQRIIRLRRAKGWSRSDLFSQSGYRSYNNLLNVELHGVQPTSATLEKLALALDTTSTYLLRGEGGAVPIQGIDEETWVSMLPAKDVAAETLARKAWELASAVAPKPQRPSELPSMERSSTDLMATTESAVHSTGLSKPLAKKKPKRRK